MTENAKKKILVGLSGGVDSAVTAHRLIEAGYEVSAGFMKNYVSDDGNCPTRIDRDEAIRVAEHLGITNFFIFDLRRQYDERIVRYLTESYARGVTPNPDVFCNTLVKFDVFAERARSLGFDAVATGHYARIGREERRVSLLK
jgi:tRNA-uridine 2-sulfurtransferase